MKSYFVKESGGIEWIKLLVPLIALWMAWVTYNGYATRHLLQLEQRLDAKYEKLQGTIWQAVAKDSARHEDRIDKLYLLIAGGENGTESNINSGERPRSGVVTNQGECVGDK